MEWEADIPGLGDPAHFDFIFSLIIRKGGIVLFTDYLTLFLLFRDYLI